MARFASPVTATIICGRSGFIYSMMMFYSFLTEAKSCRATLGADEKGG